MGIVGLAGIVVKNGILVIEFTDEPAKPGYEKTREAAIQAGTRIIPVLLTALAAILALIPLAVGFNIDFISMFEHLDPKIFFGGDNAVFWGTTCMDHHLWFGICFLYDADHCTKYVPDSITFASSDAPYVWWQMGKLFRYTNRLH